MAAEKGNEDSQKGMDEVRDILGERNASEAPDPTRVSQPSRESQLPKRFYKQVTLHREDDLFHVHLDGKPIRTPGRSFMAVGNEAVAENLGDEWRAQEERIDPMTMPITRLVNTAIDGVATDMQAVKEDIIRYCGTDHICYRAGTPDELVELQNKHWDPLIEWAQMALGTRLVLSEGIMHVDQPPESIASFSAHVGMIDDPLTLAATHVVMALTGSAVIAMAVLKQELNLEEAWAAAHVDEDWNIALWGGDEEAEIRRAKRFVEMKAACLTLQAMA